MKEVGVAGGSGDDGRVARGGKGGKMGEAGVRGRKTQCKDSSGFGSALSGRKSRREVEHLNLEVSNLNGQIRSLRSNLKAELELKGKMAMKIKKKDGHITELVGENGVYRERVQMLEEARRKDECELKNLKRKAEQVMEGLRDENHNKEDRIAEL